MLNNLLSAYFNSKKSNPYEVIDDFKGTLDYRHILQQISDEYERQSGVKELQYYSYEELDARFGSIVWQDRGEQKLSYGERLMKSCSSVNYTQCKLTTRAYENALYKLGGGAGTLLVAAEWATRSPWLATVPSALGLYLMCSWAKDWSMQNESMLTNIVGEQLTKQIEGRYRLIQRIAREYYEGVKATPEKHQALTEEGLDINIFDKD